MIRRISTKGDLKFGGERTFLSEVLVGEMVGRRRVDDGLLEVYWANVLLGWFDQQLQALSPIPLSWSCGLRLPSENCYLCARLDSGPEPVATDGLAVGMRSRLVRGW